MKPGKSAKDTAKPSDTEELPPKQFEPGTTETVAGTDAVRAEPPRRQAGIATGAQERFAAAA